MAMATFSPISSTSLSTISHTVHPNILTHLSVKDLLSIGQTCTTLNEICNAFFKNAFQGLTSDKEIISLLSCFSIYPPTTKETKSIVEFYRKLETFIPMISRHLPNISGELKKISPGTTNNALRIILQAQYNLCLINFALRLDTHQWYDPFPRDCAHIAQIAELARKRIKDVGHTIHEVRIEDVNMPCLPQEIEECSQLRKLTIHGTQIKELPPAVCRLSFLEQLSVWQNELIALPDDLGQLKNLSQIFVERNPIEQLPESICELPSLRRLGVSFTQLKKLPDNLSQCANLRHLLWKDRPIYRIADELCYFMPPGKRLWPLLVGAQSVHRYIHTKFSSFAQKIQGGLSFVFAQKSLEREA